MKKNTHPISSLPISKRSDPEYQSISEIQKAAKKLLLSENKKLITSNSKFQLLYKKLEKSKKLIEDTNRKLTNINTKLLERSEILTDANNYSEAIIAIHEPMLILDEHFIVKSASKSYYKKFIATKEDTEECSLFELGDKQWNTAKLKKLLTDLISKNKKFATYEVSRNFPEIGEKILLLNAHLIVQKKDQPRLFLFAIEDITARTHYHLQEKALLNTKIKSYKEDKEELENTVAGRTTQLELKNIELENANEELAYQNEEKEKRAAELGIANKELAFQNIEKEKRAAELGIANKELAFQNNEKEKRAAELSIANTELAFQNNEKEKRAAELSIANVELAFQNDEKEKRAAELSIANVELAFQNDEKEKRAAELSIANKELLFQNNEKEKRAAELIIANSELAFQNDEKEKRAAELSIANKDLTTFTYVSSHDLQEPLRKIQNFATCLLLEEEKNLSESGKGYFLKMRQTAKRMQALIEDLLTYSRTKSSDLNFENISIDLMLDEIMKDKEEVLNEKKAKIEKGSIGSALIIPFQFRQLMENLISNSLKFSRSTNTPHIIINGEIVPGSSLKNERLSNKNNYFHIIYTDNGIGFDPQYKDRIFEVFQRLHSKEEYKGTGMGLAICKRIIENHNGIITATGKLNKGARFDIYIPI